LRSFRFVVAVHGACEAWVGADGKEELRTGYGAGLAACTLMEQKYEFEAFPGTSLTVLRFQGVQNGAELRDAIVAKTLAADAAFIDRDAVPDLFLLQLAAFKALVAQV
jgi:hypothetical protein